MFFDEKKVKCFNKAIVKLRYKGSIEWLYVCAIHDILSLKANRIGLQNNETIRCETWINPDTHKVVEINNRS